MHIAHRLEELQRQPDTVVTVGTFDGVHRAHKEILLQTVARARARHSRSVVVTFDPHPREVVGADPSPVELLTTLEERMELFAAIGIDHLLIVRFDSEFSRLPFREFTRRYLVEGLGVAEVTEGYDHHWGRNREGNLVGLKRLGEEFGFVVHEVEPIRVDGTLVNSSNIRTLLHQGRVEDATQMLGRPYAIRGAVVVGDRRGRLLGYPTANLQLPTPRKLLPKDGIYVAGVFAEGKVRPGLLSIGVRPTFHTSGQRTIEAHILDFDGDLYGSNLRVDLWRRLRDELKFDSPELLVLQMRRDEADARRISREYYQRS